MMHEKVAEVIKIRSDNTSKSIRASDGRVVMEKEEVLSRWREYISELFADERLKRTNVIYNDEGPKIMTEEVKAAIGKMKNRKAVGDDGISVEMIKALGDFGVEKITDIANRIYDTGEVTNQMCKSTFIAIPKVQGTLECNKHRTISIMSQITKIILRVVLERIRNKIRPQISEEQFGFVRGKGTRDAIFVLRMVAEITIEVNKDIFLCFVDYEEAFDKVEHDSLIEILEKQKNRWERFKTYKELVLEPRCSS